MLVLLALIFIVMPLAELYVIIQVGHAIGALNTVLVLVVISVAGAWLARHEGLGVWRRLRTQLEAGRIPAKEMIDGVLILVAGVMLMLPGFVTDVLGLLLLLPPSRAGLRSLLTRRFQVIVRTADGVQGITRHRRSTRSGDGPGRDDIIDL